MIPVSYSLYGPRSHAGFNPKENIQDALAGDLMRGRDMCALYGSDRLCHPHHGDLCQVHRAALISSKQAEAGQACARMLQGTYSDFHNPELDNFIKQIYPPLCEMIEQHSDPEEVACDLVSLTEITDRETQGLFKRLGINITGLVYGYLYPVQENPKIHDPLVHLKQD